MSLRRGCVLIPVFAVVAFAGCNETRPQTPTTESHAAASTSSSDDGDLAPIPFTAEQIRLASPVGRTVVFRVEAMGKPVVFRVLRFVSVDEQGAEIESTIKDERGEVLDGPKRTRSQWEELRRHAAFPRALTKITEGSAETPEGNIASRVYVVRGAGRLVKGRHGKLEQLFDSTHYYFAPDRPGPPVLFYKEEGDVRVMTSVQVREEPIAAPATIDAGSPSAPIACKTDDDCWTTPDGKPMARPDVLRGKRFKPCGRDGEHAPACISGACGIRHYKC